MSFLFHLKGLLGSRVAALAAGALLVGGGLASAAPGPTVLETRPAAVGEDDDLETEDDPLADADVQQEADAGEPEEAPEEAPEEETDDAENTEELRTEADATAEMDDADGDGERSEVATAVHEALTGGLDLEPGDPGFGAAVSNNARDGGNGHAASSAARGANGSAERGAAPRDTDVTRDRGPHARGQRNGAPFGGGPEGTGPPGHAEPEEPAGP
jgi:hypothetical protein